ALMSWCTHMGLDGFDPFHRAGFNRARHARLVWQAVAGKELLYPVQAVAVAELPASPEAPPVLQFTLDVVIRASAYIAAVSRPGTALEAQSYRLPVGRLYATLDALLSTLADHAVVAAIAGMAAIDPVVIPLPASLYFVTAHNVGDLLRPDGLTQIPGAGPSRGVTLLANPTL